MNIAIVGAGITGLTAAYELIKKGHKVTVFERSPIPGGLGTYVKVGGNYIERFYHHFFQSDRHVIELIHELGIGDKLKFYSAKTGIYYGKAIYPFSTPFDLLRFSPLFLIDRVRCGAVIAYLKFLPVNRDRLDRTSAVEFLKKYLGDKIYKTIWEPLLVGKFDKYAKNIPAIWLRERLRDRSSKLGYLDGGSKTLFDTLVKKLKESGAVIQTGVGVSSIEPKKKGVEITTDQGVDIFDACLITTVSPITSKLIKNKLPNAAKTLLEKQDQLGAICVILELKKKIQSQYWLNICDLKEDVLVMVEHTNLIDKSQYENRYIVYLANYIHRDDKRFAMPDEEILKTYTKILKKVNPAFSDSWIIQSHVSRVPRAQTIFGLGSLHNRPPIQLPIHGIYMANIDQMYPHDRNFNLGVELGRKVANAIMNNV